MAHPDVVRVEASQWLLVAISGLVLACRYFLRLTRTKRTLPDDHVLVIAWVRNPLLPELNKAGEPKS